VNYYRTSSHSAIPPCLDDTVLSDVDSYQSEASDNWFKASPPRYHADSKTTILFEARSLKKTKASTIESSEDEDGVLCALFYKEPRNF
jgi:hypothetical protein